jgi:hypothetical protein
MNKLSVIGGENLHAERSRRAVKIGIRYKNLDKATASWWRSPKRKNRTAFGDLPGCRFYDCMQPW